MMSVRIHGNVKLQVWFGIAVFAHCRQKSGLLTLVFRWWSVLMLNLTIRDFTTF
jgi:hypothetical protein